MRVSAKADYAVRATVEIARDGSESAPLGIERIAAEQEIPARFLDTILGELRQHGIVETARGDSGWWLTKPAQEISVAEVVRAVEGPLAAVRGEMPDQLAYSGASAPLKDVWVALKVNVRSVLESVSLADVVAGDLPEPVRGLSHGSGASA